MFPGNLRTEAVELVESEWTGTGQLVAACRNLQQLQRTVRCERGEGGDWAHEISSTGPRPGTPGDRQGTPTFLTLLLSKLVLRSLLATNDTKTVLYCQIYITSERTFQSWRYVEMHKEKLQAFHSSLSTNRVGSLKSMIFLSEVSSDRTVNIRRNTSLT